MNRDELIELLNNNIVDVVFEKKDGTIREMRCTRKDANIPADKKPKDSNSTTIKESVLPVYDLISDGWRSFRIDSIKTVAINEKIYYTI